MANKRALLGGMSVKTENRSGFDKSRLNILTTKVGTITPIAKQLVIPSSGRIKIDLHATLPPLASDAFLRSHLKVEAFFVPFRLCYGGWESFFCGKEILSHDGNGNEVFARGKLPRYALDFTAARLYDLKSIVGAGSLADYFGVKPNLKSDGNIASGVIGESLDFTSDGEAHFGCYTNIFPWIAYHLIYDEWYRNKLVQRPVFAPIETYDSFNRQRYSVAHLPYSTFKDIRDVISYYDYQANQSNSMPSSALSDTLLDGERLCNLRQRNYGDDYFTTARPTAGGNDVVINTVGNQFTIGALRMQNALADFADVNNYASPDYVQTMSARYGVAPSSGVAQKPVLLGSADFPFFTRGTAQTASASEAGVANPFVSAGAIGAEGGKASANGQNFVCDFDVKEPGYILVLATFVPEANYATGISRDMQIFTDEGSLVDLPVALLEHVGDEAINNSEINGIDISSSGSATFGYVQRYLWHKAGQLNEVHGLFRKGMSLQSFIPQRDFSGVTGPGDITISTDFLQIKDSDLDNITAVQGWLSQYGIMIDSFIDFKVSEPLSESAVPALVNPALEHGRSIYLRSGGSKLD